MSENCNSRHLSWLIKSCLPNPTTSTKPFSTATIPTTLSLLPNDLLLEILSRLPTSSLSSISLVCKRWVHILHSPPFFALRITHNLVKPSIFAFSAANLASLSFKNCVGSWKIDSLCFPDGFSSSRLCCVGPRIFILTRYEVFCYNAWTGSLSFKSPLLNPRKKFASAVVFDKIYVAGGSSHAPQNVEEFDPQTNQWRVVSRVPRRRYGCIGASMDGVFYVIGGLKIGGGCGSEITRAAVSGAEASIYAGSMDLYDVKSGTWLRSRAVPSGGCVVAACAAARGVYVLASHAVELTFWRFEALRGAGNFGEWCRIRSPPLPTQVRLDGTVRFSCVGLEDKVVLIQVVGSIDDLLRRSGRNVRGLKEGLVLIYDCGSGEWSRGPDLPEVIKRAAVVSVAC